MHTETSLKIVRLHSLQINLPYRLTRKCAFSDSAALPTGLTELFTYRLCSSASEYCFLFKSFQSFHCWASSASRGNAQPMLIMRAATTKMSCIYRRSSKKLLWMDCLTRCLLLFIVEEEECELQKSSYVLTIYLCARFLYFIILWWWSMLPMHLAYQRLSLTLEKASVANVRFYHFFVSFIHF